MTRCDSAGKDACGSNEWSRC